MPAKRMGWVMKCRGRQQILGLAEVFGTPWGLSSHCPLQMICWGSKSPTAGGGHEDVPIPLAPHGCCSPQLRTSSTPPVLRTAPASPRQALHCWGYQRELLGQDGCCRARRDTRSAAQPPWKRCSPLGESCFFSRVCRCVIDAERSSAFQLIDNPGGGRSKCSARRTGRLPQLGQPKS